MRKLFGETYYKGNLRLIEDKMQLCAYSKALQEYEAFHFFSIFLCRRLNINISMIAVKNINMRVISVVAVFMFVLIVLSSSVSASSVKLIENLTFGSDLKPVSLGSIALGDIDNDDDLDLVVTGCSVGNVQSCTVVDNARVYVNDGTSLIESPLWQQMAWSWL
jgi:hypothetical protein